MGAAERLRDLLDERGVEHEELTVAGTTYVYWHGSYGIRWVACEYDGDLYLQTKYEVTPDEAVAATVPERKERRRWSL